MLGYFPIAQEDELLTSVLARFAVTMGLSDDKVALDRLFGNRGIVPSPLLQGHLDQLLKEVGHIWLKSRKNIIFDHTVFPLFRPFIGPKRIRVVQRDLKHKQASAGMTRLGINASSLAWPNTYKVCPLCWGEQKQLLGYTYWQRLFQTPGVVCCPKHYCSLVDTRIPLYSEHRHHSVGVDSVDVFPHVIQSPHILDIQLAVHIRELLSYKGKAPSVPQWSELYRSLAFSYGYCNGRRVDHHQINSIVVKLWGLSRLELLGLQIKPDNSWLLAMFRKHRRPFTYLHHLVTLMTIVPQPFYITDVIKCASLFSGERSKVIYSMQEVDLEARAKRRQVWLQLLKDYPNRSVKGLRELKLGARIYSWLFRFDNNWLQRNKPSLKVMHMQNNRVDWQERDLNLVRKLILLEKEHFLKLDDPRHSKGWFCRQLGVTALMEKKLVLMPLCRLFFERYSETVDEYQTRRLAYVLSSLLNNSFEGKPISAIERMAGISKKSCRLPAKTIILYDLPTWQVYKKASQRFRAS